MCCNLILNKARQEDRFIHSEHSYSDESLLDDTNTECSRSWAAVWASLISSLLITFIL